MPRRPQDYSIENHAEVYDYHRTYRPHKLFTRSAYGMLERIMQPSITYDDETLAKLPELIASDTPMMLVLNHMSDRNDQWTSAAIASKVLPEKVGDVQVLAKSTFYTGELLDEMKVPRRRLIRPLAQRAITGFVNSMGTVPIYRPGDQSSEQRRLATDAASRAWEMFGHTMEAGRPVAMYVEGTADTRDPRNNLTVKAGIGHLALQTLQEGRRPGIIIPIGVSYPEYTQRINRKGNLALQPSKLRHAHAHVGEIYNLQLGDTPSHIKRETARILQQATDWAFWHQQPAYHDTNGHDISSQFTSVHPAKYT